MKRMFGMLALGALMAGMVGGHVPSARASHCDSQVVVFGYTGGQTAVNEGAAVCILDPDDHVVDTRIINPGSTKVSVRYLAGSAGLVAVVSGFGIDGTYPLTATTGTLGTTWNTAAIDIDPTRIDSLSVSIQNANGFEYDHNCFHTLGATCPDFPPLV